MSKIISIGTAVPAWRHEQETILGFMERVYVPDEKQRRILKFLYHQSGIRTRYSVIPDYSLAGEEWQFYPYTESLEPFPALEQRMQWYHKHAPGLSVNAIHQCTEGHINTGEITHLITVSCTGMSAPGLDLQVMELLDLPGNTYRTSVNFMGCYAAIHAMKMADAICKWDRQANVMIVCTELCTLHFQKEPTANNISSSLLFADGAAAMLVTHDDSPMQGWHMDGFYGEVASKGKQDMAWELSGSGFLMKLSSYIPDLIGEDFGALTQRALQRIGSSSEDITDWCIHPGGKRILEMVGKALQLPADNLKHCYDVLSSHGNMSSATILFILKQIMEERQQTAGAGARVFGAAFGPGLTMETFVLSR
ncbi:MAG: type III polyketide synthase [Bacteroidetes bacterium]|nr:type III polyketide synthase [Bacteroidota bacterium]